MFSEMRTTPYKHGLSFLASIAFTAGFFGARIFHLAFPNLMIITQSGIHFHHFWYGLAMVIVAGWLGIAYDDPNLERIYAVVFGVGAGFIGDEVGLLLTFGDYYSGLTLDFFVAVMAGVILVILTTRYWTQVKDVLRVGRHERLAQFGIFLIVFSAIFFAFDLFEVGVPVAAAGAILVVWGIAFGRRSPTKPTV